MILATTQSLSTLEARDLASVTDLLGAFVANFAGAEGPEGCFCEGGFLGSGLQDLDGLVTLAVVSIDVALEGLFLVFSSFLTGIGVSLTAGLEGTGALTGLDVKAVDFVTGLDVGSCEGFELDEGFKGKFPVNLAVGFVTAEVEEGLESVGLGDGLAVVGVGLLGTGFGADLDADDKVDLIAGFDDEFGADLGMYPIVNELVRDLGADVGVDLAEVDVGLVAGLGVDLLLVETGADFVGSFEEGTVARWDIEAVETVLDGLGIAETPVLVDFGADEAFVDGGLALEALTPLV